MATRRANKRQQRKVRPQQRRWASLFVSLSVLLLFAGALTGGYLYLSQPHRMPLRVIEVQGEFTNLDRAAIRDTADRTIDGGFFSCDMHKLRNAVLAMPWVADVSIRRVWPDRLNMRVIERKPIARWGEQALVSADAQVFRPDALAAHADLVTLHGPPGSEQRVVTFFESALPAVRARGLEIRTLLLDERRHWWIDFANGLKLALGRDARDQRLAQFLRVYPQLVVDARRQPARVDMRYTHGFAVRWREPASLGASGKLQSQDKV